MTTPDDASGEEDTLEVLGDATEPAEEVIELDGDRDDDTASDPISSDTALGEAGDGPGGDADTSADEEESDGDAGDGASDLASEGDEGGEAVAELEDLLAALRVDLEAGILAQSGGAGWPARVEGGWLFVSTDRALTLFAGDTNGWVPEPMTSDGAGFAWIVREGARGTGYKFTDGVSWRADGWSRSFHFDEYGEMSTIHAAGRRLERWFGVTHGSLRARGLRVLVPAEPITHVLYAHDGQNLFMTGDAMLGGWRLESSAPAGMLVVGIENTVDRLDEYGPEEDEAWGETWGGRAAEYAALVREVVRPLVRRVYGEPAMVGVMGSSMGGVVSLYMGATEPGEWDFVASLSGALDWGSRSLANPTVVDLARSASRVGSVVYLDSGGGGSTCEDADGDGVNDDDPTDRDGYCVTAQLRDVLVSNGYRLGVDLWHWWEPGAAHDEAAWAARVWRPLGIFAAM